MHSSWDKSQSRLFLALAPRLADGTLNETDHARLLSMESPLLRAGFDFGFGSVGGRDELVAALRSRRPCLVFCSFFRFGAEGERAEVTEILEKEAVPFVGSSRRALELALSKSRLKSLWDGKGIDTPSSFLVRRTRTGSIAGLKLIGAARDFPYIVKPNGENENRGIHARSIAFDGSGLVSSIEAALEEYDELIVEHFLGGAESREYTVAMIGNGEGALMMPAEIRLKESRPIRVVTREDRERDLTCALPLEDPSERNRVGAFAKRALEAAGVRDYARCDLIEERGRLYALEVNGQPRLPDPWFEACARGAGMDAGQYVVAVALAALYRYASAGKGRGELPQGLREMLPVSLFERLTS